ncbi:MAG TPA: hemerythrin domain-containing protein [Usitatibacter sp.]|nr:hemerythrin domain-containing protein [Usitatibacter sp.]
MMALHPAVDDPVERLLGFHRRIERNLALLGRLPGHLEARGMDAEASAMAAAIVDCFGSGMALHMDDEERDVLPLLQRRVVLPRERDALRETVIRLHADHAEIDGLWRGLRRPLEAMAEGIERRIGVEEIRYFRALTATHVSIEEGTIHVLAARYLRQEDRLALHERMASRRAVIKRSSH